MNEVWTQIIGGLLGFGSILIGAIRYSRKLNAEREERMVNTFEKVVRLTEESQKRILALVETHRRQAEEIHVKKNGQIERLGTDFSKTILAMSATLDALTGAVNNQSRNTEINTRVTQQALSVAKHMEEEK
jgi:hypothetical protein